ncbi:MAG TPA: hypothetical protein VFF83_03985 [Clostridia bacterium]|jgi:predicted RNA-binding Zn-ribbon protein involved in translation (DUF1610 family)|nr:hypothetical protein [Clostridiales bacterium]HZX46409.1 hypothetical protein [Clostridia bacterium]
MEEKRTLTCYRCNVDLKAQKTYFEYLGHSFHADVLRCPECGEVYISEGLAKGRIAEVEMQLEDK